MPNSTLTLKRVREDVRLMLGGTPQGVAVELDDLSIDRLLAMAIRVYNRYRQRTGRAQLNVSMSVKKYEITHPGLQGVSRVDFVDAAYATGRIDPFDPWSTVTPAGIGSMTTSDRELALSVLEHARNVNSAEPDWHGQWEDDGKYYLYVDIQRDGLLCGYQYNWHVLPNDTAFGLKCVDDADVDWVIDYTIAKAKTVLARIRGKFGGITNSDGASDPTDAQDLANESSAELQALEERIKKRRRPLPPVTG
jgi:hypothetical protein